jgi:hypothetical protein
MHYTAGTDLARKKEEETLRSSKTLQLSGVPDVRPASIDSIPGLQVCIIIGMNVAADAVCS